jgi:hypothetical protein
MLGAEVAPGAVGDAKAFGDGAQVRKVVRAQAAHKNGVPGRARVGVQVRSRHGESADLVPGAARQGDFSGRQDGAGEVFVGVLVWWVHSGV